MAGESFYFLSENLQSDNGQVPLLVSDITSSNK